jgi:hypothetical protein
MDKMKFDIQLKDIVPVNDLFSKCKIYVMYAGDNRNKSSIEKSVVEKALPSLFNIPIIGEYSETLEDFRGHGGKIEITDDGVKYIQTTRPYGVIPESSEVAWETVIEDDKTTHEYLTCTGYLWTRYSEVESVIANGKGQSMEIEEVEGETRKDGVYQIKSFTFSALTILGDDVTPCFEGASVVAYSLDKDNFKKEFDLMVKELKSTISGGGEMEKENFENQNLEGQTTEPEATVPVAEPVVEPAKEPETFTLSSEQLREEIRRQLYSQTYRDEWGYTEYAFWYVDYDNAYVYAKDAQGKGVLVAMSYTATGDIISIDFNSKQRVKISYTPLETGEVPSDFSLVTEEEKEFAVTKATKDKEGELNKTIEDKESKIFELNTEITRLNGTNKELTDKVDELSAYKLKKEADEEKAKKDALFEEFSVGLTQDEMQPIKDKASEMKYTDIKAQLNELFTEKNLAEMKKAKKNETPEVIMDTSKKESKNPRYAI